MYSAINRMMDMHRQSRQNDVPLSAVHMAESESHVIMGNADDVEWSWTAIRAKQ